MLQKKETESSDQTDSLPELEAVVQSGDFDLSEVINFNKEELGNTTDTAKLTDTANVPSVNSADTKQSFEERAL